MPVSRSDASCSEVSCGLTDPWQLFTGDHVDNAHSPDARFHDDGAWMLANDAADDGGISTTWMTAHRVQDPVTVVRRHKRDQRSFVGDIQGIESQDLTGSFHFIGERDAFFPNADPDM